MFNLVQFGTEIQALKQNRYVQTDLLVVDLSTVVNDLAIDIPAGATMLALVPLVLDRNGNQQQSNTAGRCFIKLNSPTAPGIPFSLIAASGDQNVLTAAMVRLYVSVPTAVAGKLYFVLGTGVGVASATGGPSGGGYSPTYGGGATAPSSSGPSGSGGSGGGGGPQLL